MRHRSFKSDVNQARQRVLDYLRMNGKGRTVELAEVYGIGTLGNARAALRRMCTDGWIAHTGRGQWCLSGKAPQQLLAEIVQLPSSGRRGAAMQIHDLVEALRGVQGIEGAAATEVKLAEMHLIRATDHLRGLVRHKGQNPLLFSERP